MMVVWFAPSLAVSRMSDLHSIWFLLQLQDIFSWYWISSANHKIDKDDKIVLCVVINLFLLLP
jgi:hypothetical protein